MTAQTTSRSKETHYIDVFLFAGQSVFAHHMHYCTEKESGLLYQRGINKYKSYKVPVMINLREINHTLVRSELLNYVKPKTGKR